jgi:amidase
MQLLEPGFEVADGSRVPGRVGRVGRPGDPAIAAAVDRALAAAELEVTPVDLPAWEDVSATAATWLVAEAWEADRSLAHDPDALSPDVAGALAFGRSVSADQLAAAKAACASWRDELITVMERVGLLALPTLPAFPPTVDDPGSVGSLIVDTIAANAAGLPAVAVPVPTGGPLPASLQLVGPPGGEDVLLALAATVEAAVA